MPDDSDIRVDPNKLQQLGVRALVAAGVAEEHARMTADVLLIPTCAASSHTASPVSSTLYRAGEGSASSIAPRDAIVPEAPGCDDRRRQRAGLRPRDEA